MQKVHEGGSPHGFARKRKKRRLGNLEPSWGPQVLHKCCEGNRENSDGSVCGLLFDLILIKIDDFGGQGRPCTGLGQGLEIGVHKKQFMNFYSSIREPIFVTFGHFGGSYFQCISE